MKMLIITGSMYNNYGGPFLSVRSLAVAMLNRGHSVVVIGSKDQHSQPDLPPSYKPFLDKYDNLKVFALKKYGPYNLHFTPTVKRHIQEEIVFDVLLIQGIWMWNCWRSFWFAYRRNIPIIVSVRGEFNQSSSISEFKKQLLMPWIRFMLNKSIFVHVLNENEQKILRTHGIHNKIKLIPNGVDLPEKTRYDFDNKNILFLSRLHPMKNIISMINAWKKTNHKDWNLIIAGGGKLSFENEIRLLCNNDTSITLLGPVNEEDKRELFLNTGWFTLPSLTEGMPMAVLEAMSYGIPIIISEECNLNKAIELGAGIFSGTSENDIKDAFQTAIDLQERERINMSNVCLKLANTVYSWEHISSIFEKEIYENINL